MGTDDIEIAWIGSRSVRDRFATHGETLTWFHTKQALFEDTDGRLAHFPKGPRKRFADGQELRKEEQAMKSLQYGGSISNFVAPGGQ